MWLDIREQFEGKAWCKDRQLTEFVLHASA